MKNILFVSIILSISACSSRPEYNPLSQKWARHINSTGKTINGLNRVKRIRKAETLRKKARALHGQRRYALALQQYEAAIRLYADGKILFHYADTLSNLRLKDSVTAYTIALKLKPAKPHLVLYNLACAYSRLKNAAAGYTTLMKAVKSGYTATGYILRDPDLAHLRKQPQWKKQYRALQQTLKNTFLNSGTPIEIFRKYYMGRRLAYFFMPKYNKYEYRFYANKRYKAFWSGSSLDQTGTYILKNRTIRFKSDRGGYVGMWREIRWLPISPNQIKLDNTIHDIIH